MCHKKILIVDDVLLITASLQPFQSNTNIYIHPYSSSRQVPKHLQHDFIQNANNKDGRNRLLTYFTAEVKDEILKSL